MDDKSIRSILISWLQANYSECRIYQEKSIGDSVCDLMMVTDCLTGFEIKSDLDNYRRLDKQVHSYQQYFDYNYIVVGESHRASVQYSVPSYWGILVVRDDGIRSVRAAQYCNPQLKCQLRILWRIELNNILNRLNIPLMTYKSKDYVIQCLSEAESNKELRRNIHDAMAYELLHRDYSLYDADDPTIQVGAKEPQIHTGMPVSEMIDTLSEQNLQQFTLDQWISLYTQAKEIREAKASVYQLTKDRKERADTVPHTVTYTDIEVSPGVPWVSQRIIDEFIFYLSNGEELWESKTHEAKIWKERRRVSYEPITGYWYISDKIQPDNFRLNFEYGLPDYNALYIFEAMLNLREIHRNTQEETVSALEKQEKIRTLFREWLWRDKGRRWEVEESYNKLFGQFGVKQFDGSALRFPEMSKDITLYPYQKDAVQRIINEKNTLLAFDVGAGKTYIMIAAAMKMRQEGISRKNLFVVPNNIVGQWELIFQKMYPAAKLLTVDPGGFKPGVRQKILNQIRCGDYDGIIMAYSCFEMIPLSSEFILAQMEEELQKIQGSLHILRYATGLGPALEREEKTIRNVANQLVETMHATKNEITFDQLEINTLFVDEAHNFKNIPIQSRLRNISGINLKGSEKCLHMQRKVSCVQEQNNGRGIVFATGTPLCNSISDAYALQMYLQPEVMKESHLDRFDNWVKSFAQPERVCEIDVDTSKFRFVQRFARFFNLPELSKMFSSVAAFYAVQNDEDLPELSGYEDILIEKSPELQKYMEKLCERTEQIRARKIDKSYDNMLKVSTDGRKAALDLRLVGQTQPEDDYSKTAQCVEQVMKLYNEHPGCAQIIFCDYSTPKNGKFNVYAELRRRLSEKGVPKKEIAFIHSYASEASKVSLYEKVNSGEVRILIGSTFKLGIGANVQTHLKAIHHLDVPWRPADMVQREGRIMRKGNQNKEIKIFRYITKGSFDSYSWQILETKQKFISQFLAGSAYQRSASDLEENVLTYAQVKALSISEPLMKTLAEKQNELRQLQLLSAAFQKSLEDAQKSIKYKEERLADADKRLINTAANAEYLSHFSAQQYKQAIIPIKGLLSEDVVLGIKPVPVNTSVMDFIISVPEKQNTEKPYLCLKRLDTVYSMEVGASAEGNVRRLYNFFTKFSKQQGLIEKQQSELRASIEELKKTAAQTDPYPARIAVLKKECGELQKKIMQKNL